MSFQVLPVLFHLATKACAWILSAPVDLRLGVAAAAAADAALAGTAFGRFSLQGTTHVFKGARGGPRRAAGMMSPHVNGQRELA